MFQKVQILSKVFFYWKLLLCWDTKGNSYVFVKAIIFLIFVPGVYSNCVSWLMNQKYLVAYPRYFDLEFMSASARAVYAVLSCVLLIMNIFLLSLVVFRVKSEVFISVIEHNLFCNEFRLSRPVFHYNSDDSKLSYVFVVRFIL